METRSGAIQIAYSLGGDALESIYHCGVVAEVKAMVRVDC